MTKFSSIDPAARIGAVHLTIADLPRSIRFYESHLGFELRRGDGLTAWLGAGGHDLLVLAQAESAPRPRGTTGLYHFAVLVPSRGDLAWALHRLIATSTPMQGASDHGVSEALYLADPDGNGIEIYRDRPRAEWPYAGGLLRMGTDPLDLEALLADRVEGSDTGLADGTVIGHVHLHVAALDAAERFYVGILGFDLMQRFGASAAFVSAGGYHHHVGLNTWAGVGAPPPPPGAIGLRYFDVVLPDVPALADVERRLRTARIPIEAVNAGFIVRDPSRNAIRLIAADERSTTDD